MDKWAKRWNVEKSTGEGYWVVAVTGDGEWGCSCPQWKFRRKECKHIVNIKYDYLAGKGSSSLPKKADTSLKKTVEPTHSFVKPKVEIDPVAIQSAISDVDSKLEEIMGRLQK